MAEEVVRNNKLSLTDVAVLANISMYRNNNITEFRYVKNIAEVVGVSLRTVKSSIAKLKEENAFEKIEKINVKGDKEFRNRYFFTPLDKKFIIVSDNIFESNLTSDEIGFLIRAKAKCYYNSMVIKGNKEVLASFIGVSSGKFNKLLKSLEAKGLVKYSQSELTLTNDLFKDTSSKIIKPTELTKDILKTHKLIIESHFQAYNNKHRTHQLTEANRNNLEILHSYGLSTTSYQLGLYMINNFEGVKDINKLVTSLTNIPTKDEFKVTLNIEL